MRKLLVIGWKDLVIIFRDRSALLLMLAAPFALTVALALTSGRFSDEPAGPSAIPLALVNADDGPRGDRLAGVLTDPELADLVRVTTLGDSAAARAAVADDTYAAAIIVPAGHSAGDAPIELHANPGRPVGASVAAAIVEQVAARETLAATAAAVTAAQLLATGRLTPEEAPAAAATVAERVAALDTTPITVAAETADGNASAATDFDPLAYIAPGMAIFFLMYTVTAGARSILAERDEGTLARLFVSPTRSVEVLGGKVLGTFLSGLAQLAILILASGLLFGVEWGSAGLVALLAAGVAAAATAWGMILAAFSHTPSQINQNGTALMLTFGFLGGTFLPVAQFPGWVRPFSWITPHAWGLDGFVELSLGGGLAAIWPSLAALTAMTAVLFAMAVLRFRRQFG